MFPKDTKDVLNIPLVYLPHFESMTLNFDISQDQIS